MDLLKESHTKGYRKGGKDEDPYISDRGDNKRVVRDYDGGYVPVKPRSYQFKALFRKNIKLQMRQRCTLACQIAVPFILVLFVGIMQLMFNYLVLDQQSGFENPGLKNFQNLSSDGTFFLGANPNSLPDLGQLEINGTRSGFLGMIPQLKDKFGFYIPFAALVKTRDDLMSALKKAKESFMATLQKGVKSKYIPFPALAFTFNEIKTQASEGINFDLEVLTETQFPYVLWYSDNNPSQYEISGVNTMINNFVTNSSSGKVQIASQERELPYEESPLPLDIGSFLAALTYPLVLSWLLPVYVYNIVLEKQDRLREMMKMSGLKMRNYWMVTYLYDYILYLGVLIVVYALSYAFQFAIFTQGSIIFTLILFLLWGHAQIATSFVFSAIFGSTRVATIFCYFLVIVQSIVSYVVNVTVFADSEPPFFWMCYPPFAFYRSMFVLGYLCGLEKCPTDGDWTIDSELVHTLFYLFFCSIAAFLLAFYLDEVLPKQYGISKKPWFFLNPIFRGIRRLVKGSKSTEYVGGHNAEDTKLLIKTVPRDDEDEDQTEGEDVARERAIVYNREYSPEAPIVIKDLKKLYGSRWGGNKHLAVRGLNLAIESGDCFGLLGPNGAGKTTTISMLTGLYPPSSGTAYVGGYDIRTDIDCVHRVMGVCPQFDTLWLDLTCTETLLFYARLKGVSSKDEDSHVLDSLAQVGLESFGKRLVSDLSGGMRRRLSVAVSLVGNPRIVFLDEPTTGLDPESRRQLWDVLVQVKAGRCIILTTHSMEEADVLCTKIGIMSKGALRCVGPQQQLKQRFGQGYSLKVNFDAQQADDVDRLIKKILPTAVCIEDFIGSRTYQIPTEDVVISRLFELMQEQQNMAGITDWGINQTSLEDVFLHIVRNDEGASDTLND
eukprot:TRINITY_DN395_c6_g1_i1.p1 TRINITY_DN395_c6_g1~~TRINITY_DN395_c6_g1_i1.p1  ORF type:complete len:890 (-),score=121.35 TRINITY_DN395_c6_g1_i1:212-2881(-)